MKTLRHRGTIAFGIMARLAAIVALSLFVHLQMGGSLPVPGWIGHAMASTDSRSVYFPPLTGNDMVRFLEEHSDRLRSTLTDYDGLYTFSKNVGDRPLIEAMRDRIDADNVTAAVETPALEAPKTPEAP